MLTLAHFLSLGAILLRLAENANTRSKGCRVVSMENLLYERADHVIQSGILDH